MAKTQKAITIEVELTLKDNETLQQAKDIAHEVIRMAVETRSHLEQLSEICATTSNPLILAVALNLVEQLSQLTGDANAGTVGVSQTRSRTTSTRNPKVPS